MVRRRRSSAANHRQRRGPDGAEGAAVARVHLAAAGAAVQQIIVVGSRAEHAEHHLGDLAVRRRADAVHQIERRVGRRPIGRPLAAHQHDRHRASSVP